MQRFKTTILLGLLVGTFLAVGYSLNGHVGALIALFLAIFTNFGMYWFSDKIVLKMQGAVPLDENKYKFIKEMTTELSTKDKLPMPKLYFVDSPIPNAFATGRSKKKGIVAVTRGLLEILEPAEIKAVLAHELGHIKNRDMLVSTIAATIAGAVSFLIEMAFWGGALFGGNDDDGNNIFGSLAFMMLVPIMSVLIQMAVSRSREYGADQHAKKLLGDGRDLASALLKLESFKPRLSGVRMSATDRATAHMMFQNMFAGAGLIQLFSTHPSTENRVKKLI